MVFLKNLIPVLPCYNGLFQKKSSIKQGKESMWKFQGRAYSRSICGSIWYCSFNPLSVLYWNKALWNFCNRGQCSIVQCNIRSKTCPAGGILGISRRCQASYKFAEFPGVKCCFPWDFQFKGFSQKSLKI